MSVLIGGSGSTGSSLLRTILNRHSQIFSGGELNFFNKKQYFKNWSKYKSTIIKKIPLRKQLTTQGWFSYPGHNLLHKEYCWNKEDLYRLVQQAVDIKDFSKIYFDRSLKSNDKKMWIEKTPSNSYCFSEFLKYFKNGKVIHCSRNPLDTVASLTNRGMNSFFASGLYVYNTACALSVANDKRYLLVKYEDLIKNTNITLKRILNFLNLKFEVSILFPEKNIDKSKSISSWNYNSHDGINSKNIGTFNRLSSERQNEIITALSLFEISKKHIQRNNLFHKNCLTICEELNYNFKAKVYKNYKNRYMLSLLKDIFHRTRRLYSTNLLYYPARIF